MLKAFEDACVNDGYFTKMKIKEIEKSCCKNSDIEVIDFDKTKEKLMTHIHKAGVKYQLKSCDCLKVVSNCKGLDFIEIKSIAEYINYYKAGKSKSPKKQVEKFNIIAKYNDSVHLIRHLSYMMGATIGVDKSQEINKIQPNLIILTDVDTRNDSRLRFTVTMAHLSTNSNKEELGSKLKTACLSAFQDELDKNENPAPKKFLFCEHELEAYYSKLG